MSIGTKVAVLLDLVPKSPKKSTVGLKDLNVSSATTSPVSGSMEMRTYVGCFFAAGQQFYFGRDTQGFPVGPFPGREGYLMVLGAIEFWNTRHEASSRGDEESWSRKLRVDPKTRGVRLITKLPDGLCIIEFHADDGLVSYHTVATGRPGPIDAARALFSKFGGRDFGRYLGFNSVTEAAATLPEDSVTIMREEISALTEDYSSPSP